MPYEFIYLRRSFITGTMRAEAAYTRMLFLTLLFENTHGVITATPDFLSTISGLTLEAVERALERLMAPDPQSTSLAEDGRRIVPVEGKRNTWRIVNWSVYQPALADPETDPTRPPRRLADGSDNPAYFAWAKRKQREAKRAAQHLEENMAGIDGGGGHNGGQDQVQNEDDVHQVHLKEGKVNQTKSDTSPKSPPGTSTKKTPTPSRKALDAKGKREHDEPWSRFDAAYPRRSDGKSINRADARLIFDALLDAGEDADKIVDGCQRYAAFLREKKETKYIKMMTTWLNGRCWEESWYIHPDSELGQQIAARKADERKARRSAHQREMTPAYEEHVRLMVIEWAKAPGLAAEWEADQEALIERREKMGMSAGARMIRETLSDPQKRQDALLNWVKERHAAEVPEFWRWDKETNPSPFQDEVNP